MRIYHIFFGRSVKEKALIKKRDVKIPNVQRKNSVSNTERRVMNILYRRMMASKREELEIMDKKLEEMKKWVEEVKNDVDKKLGEMARQPKETHDCKCVDIDVEIIKSMMISPLNMFATVSRLNLSSKPKYLSARGETSDEILGSTYICVTPGIVRRAHICVKPLEPPTCVTQVYFKVMLAESGSDMFKDTTLSCKAILPPLSETSVDTCSLSSTSLKIKPGDKLVIYLSTNQSRSLNLVLTMNMEFLVDSDCQEAR